MLKGNAARVESMWGSLIGDALSMPVHWFYNVSDIPKHCGGWIKGYIPPPAKHPTSILTISAVDSSGRSGSGPKGQKIIGNIILHDKLKYWESGDRTTHYHRGMAAGDNTLTAKVALLIMKQLAEIDPNREKSTKELFTAVFEKYVTFMTTPGTHNDTYADSFHRLFFRDWAALEDPPKSGKNLMNFIQTRSAKMLDLPPDSQVPCVGALVLTVPWIAHYGNVDENRATEAAVAFLKLTHPAKGFESYTELFSRSLHRVINGKSVKEVSRAALLSNELGLSASQLDKFSGVVSAHQRGSESELAAFQDVTSRMGIACYIKGALSIVFFLAHQFHDDFKSGILMNTNVGGDNCGRGTAIGALLGAASAGQTSSCIPDELKTGLNSTASEWLREQERAS